jgi:hypothetical protein
MDGIAALAKGPGPVGRTDIVDSCLRAMTELRILLRMLEEKRRWLERALGMMRVEPIQFSRGGVGGVPPPASNGSALVSQGRYGPPPGPK